MLKLLLGDPNARKLKRFQPIVSDINLLEEEIAPLSDADLRGKTAAFERLANAVILKSASHSLRNPSEAFAVVREAGKRFGDATFRRAVDRQHGPARRPDRRDEDRRRLLLRLFRVISMP